MNEIAAKNTAGWNVKLPYALYIVGMIFPLLSVIGVIVAYVNKGDGEAWTQSHYQFQIRTFWIGLLYSVISGILCFIVIGWFLLLLVFIWSIVRSVKGFKAADNGQPIGNPTSWAF